MDIFTLDIGGAFIKTSLLPERGRPRQRVIPFELWKNSGQLAKLLKSIGPVSRHVKTAITMTGELCDCFKNRLEGVRHIVTSAQKAYGTRLTVFGRKLVLYRPEEAIRKHAEVASANWAIVPTWLGYSIKNFLLIDIGSTTTDLTPVRNGKIANRGFCDFDRLANGELIYTGYLRTPLPAVVKTLMVGKKKVPVASETFCIMGDVHFVRGKIIKSQYNCPTPDGRAKTGTAALARLARTVLSDRKNLGDAKILKIANEAAKAQSSQITTAAKRFGLKTIITGAGAFILDGAGLRAYERADTANLDPSLALALLIKNRLL